MPINHAKVSTVPDNPSYDVGSSEWNEAHVGSGVIVVSDVVNGLVSDYDPPGGIDGASVLLLDPSAKPWEAGRSYGVEDSSILGTGTGQVPAFVHPTGNDAVRFDAHFPSSAVSGAAEPEWSDDGATAVLDGSLVWTPFAAAYEGVWTGGTGYDSGDYVLADGSLWAIPDAGGTSGLVAPDWSAGDEPGGTVVDNDIAWYWQGPASVWEAETIYAQHVTTDHSNYYSDNVIPSVAGDYLFNLQGVFVSSAVSGSVEPDWGAEEAGTGNYYDDGNIIWVENDGSEVLQFVGLMAPADAASVTIANVSPTDTSATIEVIAEEEAEGNEPADARPAEGNGFGAAATLAPFESRTLAYVNGQWWPLTPAS